MSKAKNAKVIYVAPIPKERSGIGRDVPAHVKVEWRDEQGRRNTREIPWPDYAVQDIAKLPDADLEQDLAATRRALALKDAQLAKMREALTASKIDHEGYGDYCQRLNNGGDCTCGADGHNERIKAALAQSDARGETYVGALEKIDKLAGELIEHLQVCSCTQDGERCSEFNEMKTEYDSMRAKASLP